MLNVVCIGAGRLANQLMPALEEAGCHILQVYNRSTGPAQLLADKLKNCSFVSEISQISPDADLYFLTVSDDAIKPLSLELMDIVPVDAIGIHCSGSLGLDVLPFRRKAGFYPLQSFLCQS